LAKHSQSSANTGKGVRNLGWRVGNGANIKIWGDKWLPSPTSFQVQTPVRVLHHDAKVVDLIDPTTKEWKFQLIGEIFEQEEATMICNLPLSPLLNNDKQVWLGSKSGFFLGEKRILYGEF
jgi:hypothetical protein